MHGRSLRQFLVATSFLLAATVSVTVAQDDMKDEEKTATHKVKAGPLQVKLKLDGTFEADNAVGVSLRPRGTVKLEVKQVAKHGTLVKKGDTILTLDTESIDRALHNAKLGVDLSELDLSLAELELNLLQKSTQLDMAAAANSFEVADEALQYFLNTSRKRSEESTKFSLEGARHRLEYAQEELKQLRQMYQADDLTEETEEIILKRAERSVKSAEFSLVSQELRTKRTLETELPQQEKSVKEAAERAAISFERSKASIPAGLEKAKITLQKTIHEHKETIRKFRELQSDRKLFTVTAPIDGYVYYGSWTNGKWSGKASVESSLKIGGTIAPKQTFMTIVSPKVVRIRASVSEKDFADVRPGIVGTASAKAFTKTKLKAQVAHVSPIPSSAGSFDAVVNVAAGGAPIVAGMSGSVELTVYDKARAITIPSKAVFGADEDDPHVFVVTEDGNAKRTVKTGRKKSDDVEILDGLNEGDEILLSKPDTE